MNFMRELQLGDDVQLLKSEGEKQTSFTVTKADKPCFALELNWK
jgi:hypothetical protein